MATVKSWNIPSIMPKIEPISVTPSVVKKPLQPLAAPISAGEMFMVMKGATQLLRKV